MKTSLRMLFAVVLAAGTLTVSTMPVQAAETVNAYLNVEGIKGSSETHTDAIALVSYKLGVGQKSVTETGKGAGGAKAQFTPLTVFKYIDKSSTELFKYCTLGKRIPSVELWVYPVTEGTEGAMLQKIKLIDVVVTSANSQTAEENSANILLESYSFSYAKIEVSYLPDENPTPGLKFDLSKNVTY